MTKYIAVLKNGKEITKTTEDGIRNRLDFYNWISKKQLGEVKEITCRPYGK